MSSVCFFLSSKGHKFMDLNLCFLIISDDKESACNAGELGLIPELGRSPGEGNSYPLQYS